MKLVKSFLQAVLSFFLMGIYQIKFYFNKSSCLGNSAFYNLVLVCAMYFHGGLCYISSNPCKSFITDKK